MRPARGKKWHQPIEDCSSKRPHCGESRSTTADMERLLGPRVENGYVASSTTLHQSIMTDCRSQHSQDETVADEETWGLKAMKSGMMSADSMHTRHKVCDGHIRVLDGHCTNAEGARQQLYQKHQHAAWQNLQSIWDQYVDCSTEEC